MLCGLVREKLREEMRKVVSGKRKVESGETKD
jgi:hypothetical protein